MGLRGAFRPMVPLALAALAACTVPAERQAREALGALARGDGLAVRPGIGPAPDLPALTAESSVGDFVKHAVWHNPGLRAAFERWRAALLRVPQATALADPGLTLMAMWQEGAGIAQRRLEVGQGLPWPGKRQLRGEMALAEAEAARRQFEAASFELAYQVKDAYCELYYLSRAIAILSETIELAKQAEAVARSRYQVGNAQYADVIRAQVELGKLDNELQSMEDMKTPVFALLNAAMDRPPAAPLPVPKAIPEAQLDADAEQLLARMREANPMLKMAEAEIAKQDAALRLADRNFYPDFMLGLRLTDAASMMGADSLMPMLGLTLPVWRSKYRAARDEAEALHDAARRALADRANELSTDLTMALFKLRDSERRVSLYRDNLLPRAEQAYKATQTAYTSGKATFSDLIDAQRVLLEFRLAHARALTMRVQRLAEIEKLIGRPLSAAATPAAPEKGEKADPPDRATKPPEAPTP